MPPAIPAIAAVATAGAAVASASAQNKAIKKAKGESEAVERMNQVNEIKALTANAIPAGSPEFLAFAEAVNKNPEGIALAQEESKKAISAYSSRIGEEQNKQQKQATTIHTNDVSALGLPNISSISTALADLSVLNNKLDSINPAKPQNQNDYTPLIILAGGAVAVLLITKLKR
jgi:hypothetical protein